MNGKTFKMYAVTCEGDMVAGRPLKTSFNQHEMIAEAQDLNHDVGKAVYGVYEVDVKVIRKIR